ncbi:MAG: metallophosphoesterase family protein [Sulfitobacter sp.]
MKHLDLGVLDGPVLLFGGPYSNAQALNALLDVAKARAISHDHMICTGDVVAYCGSPVDVVAQMRRFAIPIVAGNCEIQLGQGASDCGCGFDAGSECDLLSDGWYRYTSAALSGDDKAWMAQLPDILSFSHQGARYAVIHGGVKNVARFMWSTTPLEDFTQEWDHLAQAIGPVEHIISGHCGIPFVKDTGRGSWINAGVIGMPPHDGAQQTRFALLDGGQVLIQRLRYDAQGAVDAMKVAGLPEDYRRALITGYWPSEDILPTALRSPSLAKG